MDLGRGLTVVAGKIRRNSSKNLRNSGLSSIRRA